MLVMQSCTDMTHAGEFETFYFGQNHPMKPHRLAMTHHLVLGYGLHKKMDVYRPRKAYPVELAQFHADDYVEFLSRWVRIIYECKS